MISIELSNSEALVLFDFLSRFNEKENNKVFQDQSEQRVLWDIECTLESQLVEPLRKDYNKLLEKAREEVRD